MAKTDFSINEASIDSVHQAFLKGILSARRLVEIYLGRIEDLDRSGPNLNAIITVNAAVLDEADTLDHKFAATGSLVGPLHGIPIVVKDQIETKGIMTTFGSAAQDGYIPADDATAISKLKAAGALVLAKTALPDYATSWFGSCSQQGKTRNPYNLAFDPGGSSGGTAAAVAANCGLLGIGEDTGGSIRLPASFCNLVGMRVTPGLISRHGMSPLVKAQDTAGPMTRTVRDTAILLDVMVGFDAMDPYTSAAVIGGRAGQYVRALDPKDGLKTSRIGVLRNAFGDNNLSTAPAVNAVIEHALDAMRTAGAEVVDVDIPSLMDWIIKTSVYLDESKYNIDAFLASRLGMPTPSLNAVEASGKFDPTLDLLLDIFKGPAHPREHINYYEKVVAGMEFQRLLVGLMAKTGVVALVFPAVRILPPSKADLDAGKHACLTFPTNTLIASQSLTPSICMPAGFSTTGLPVGIEFVAPPYRELDLIRLASAFEYVTQHRCAPSFLEA